MAASLLSRDRSGCCADFFPPLLPILRRKSFTVGFAAVADVIYQVTSHGLRKFAIGLYFNAIVDCASHAQACLSGVICPGLESLSGEDWIVPVAPSLVRVGALRAGPPRAAGPRRISGPVPRSDGRFVAPCHVLVVSYCLMELEACQADPKGGNSFGKVDVEGGL
jgi:hypothetical protein